MLIDLHAHHLTKNMLAQHPHWGPFWEYDDLGDMHLRVGKWVLSLSTPERRAEIKAGKKAATDVFERLFLPENRLAAMDSVGVDKLVMSLPSHCYMYWSEPEFNVRYARLVNDELAKFCTNKPDRLYFWAHLPMQDPKASVKELERAVTKLGAKGAGMGGANFGGLEFDDESYDPLWEKFCELQVPIFIHGYNQSATWGDAAATERYEITAIVGMCYDESRCFWNLVCGGVLDRFPRLQIYITHGGGYVPYQLGRFEATNSVLGDAKNQKPVREYFKSNFWFDPLIHDLPMRRAVVEIVGPDRLLYGDNFGGSDGVRGDLTQGLELSETDRNKIKSENAKKLLKL